MLPLYLLAAHLLGDFVFQTRWQAAGKLDDGFLRARHVTAYVLPFIPIAFAYARPRNAVASLLLLWAMHAITDSRRFYSTLGDVIAWRLVVPDEKKIEAHSRPHPHPMMGHVTMRPSSADGLRLPANPWPAIPLMVDQTLHVCQLAILGGLFLT